MKRVAVAIITRKNPAGDDEYLLMSSKKEVGEFTGAYYPPGGGIEEGESSADAVVRELCEELDLPVHPLHIIATTSGDVPNSEVDWWACDALSDEWRIMEDIVADARFMSRAEIANIQPWPATQKFFDDYVWKDTI